MLYFRASEEIARQIVANAVASALSLGVSDPLLENAPEVSWRDIAMDKCRGIQLHYYQRRSVHIHFERINSTLWRVRNSKRPLPLLQSWSIIYPSWESLISSVRGAKVLNPLV